MRTAARILGTIAPGLDEAHSNGIVHRDIKPSNILFDKRGNPYISDFGIAKLSQAQSGNVTGSAIIGTPAYMAPEQAQGIEVDGRADIYALGIILFEILTGKQPYEADTPMAVAIKHITDPVPHIRQTNPKLPEAVDTIIQKAMAKDKTQRFSTAVEMTNAVRDAIRGGTIKLPAKPTVSDGAREAPPTVKASVQPLPAKKGFNALVVIIPIIAIAALAGGFFSLTGTGDVPPLSRQSIHQSSNRPPCLLPTETSAPANTATDVPVVITQPTITETSLPATPTTAAIPSLPVLGGADKIAFVANNEIWAMNVDGSGLEQLTVDGGVKNDLQWLPDGENIVFISGLTIKYYNIKEGVVEYTHQFSFCLLPECLPRFP